MQSRRCHANAEFIAKLKQYRKRYAISEKDAEKLRKSVQKKIGQLDAVETDDLIYRIQTDEVIATAMETVISIAKCRNNMKDLGMAKRKELL
jgi:hypothetical protein